MAALDEFFKRLQQLREYDSVQEVLADPFARMLAAGVLSVVMLLLVFLQPYPEDEKKGEPPSRRQCDLITRCRRCCRRLPPPLCPAFSPCRLACPASCCSVSPAACIPNCRSSLPARKVHLRLHRSAPLLTRLPHPCLPPTFRRRRPEARAAGLHAGRGGAAQGGGRPVDHYPPQGQQQATGGAGGGGWGVRARAGVAAFVFVLPVAGA